MLIAATVLFATISFVIYQKSSTAWLLSSRLRNLLTGSDPANQSRDPSSASSAQDGSFEKPVSKRNRSKKKEDNENENVDAEPSSHFSQIKSPSIQVHDSEVTHTNSKFRLEDSDDDNYTPSFPSLTSAQRASQLHPVDDKTSSAQRDAQLMPPPRAPPQAPRLVNISSIAAGNRTSQLASSTRHARIADTVASTRNLNSQNITNVNVNAKSKSGSLMVPPLARPHQNLPSANTSKAQNPRQKITLKPGRSPLDWANLTRSGQNLSGVPVLQRVRPSTLKYNNGRAGKPAWSSYHGKVYNVTPFLPYHPGGEGELMRAAGKDGGKLFMDVHPWVSWENMLEDCLVGILVSENDGVGTGEDNVDGKGASTGLDDIE